MNIKTLQIVSSIDKTCGGPSKSVTDLSSNLAGLGISVSLLANYSDNPVVKRFSNNKYTLNLPPKKFFNKELSEIINNSEFDLLHGHGLWQKPVHVMSNIARSRNVPYVITPRGMLEPWALNAGKWKKKIALALYQKRDLSNASCIHATAEMEAENIRKLGFNNPIAVIPNGIDIMEFSVKETQIEKAKKTILFLSRIHPKKGIELLIEAWEKIGKKIKENWQIEIAGNGEEDYIESLNTLIETKGLQKEISIIGAKFGKEKIDTYQNADLFVLPTYSENFGIVVAEALACGVPVITTKGTPWEELNEHKAGWWIDIGAEPLAEVLKEAITLSDDERKQMGINGRKLVEEKYSIKAVAEKMIQLYGWILKKNEKPNFVYLD